MFDFKTVTADAHALEVKVEADLEGREAELVSFVKEKLEEIAKEIGGHIAFSGGGHFHPVPGRTADKLWVNFLTMPKPEQPVSTGNDPPESVVAFPQPADGVTLPEQPSVPQADPNAVPVVVEDSSPTPQQRAFERVQDAPPGTEWANH